MPQKFKISVLLTLVLNFWTTYASVDNRYIDSLQQVIRQLSDKGNPAGSDTLLFKTWNEIARQLSSTMPDSSFAILSMVIQKMENTYASEWRSDINFKKILATSYNQRGIQFSNLGNYVQALENYKHALDLRKESEDKKGIANIYNNMGVVYKNLGNYPEAIRNHLEALKIRETIADSTGIAMSRNNIGSAYFFQDNYSEAYRNYAVALELRRKLRDPKGVAGTLNNIGNIAEKQGKFEEALTNYKMALNTAIEIADLKLEAECYNNLGNSYFRQGLNTEARKNFTEALKTQEEIGDKRGLLTTCKNIGLTFMEEKKYDKVIAYLNRAMTLAQEIHSKDQEMILYRDYAQMYANTHQYDLAYENQVRYSELRDTLMSAVKNQQIAEFQTRYETEKKDKEISLLNKEKAIKTAQLKNEKTIRHSILFGSIMAFLLVIILVNRYRVLTEQRKKTENAEFEKELHELQMKALRSQMNPHFIFNCLNSVQRYILKNDKHNAVEYLQKFASLMRLILDNSERNMVTLLDEITMLDLYMHLESLRIDQGMDIEIIVDEHLKQDEILIPSMILQPFVENAILHGLLNKDGKGKIKIEVRLEGSLLKCSIEDNGIGRKMAQEIKAKRSVKHQSKGLSITQARIELLNQMYHLSNTIVIKDLKSTAGVATGTYVEVGIPVSLFQD